ncbi:ATPase [Mycobacterium sp. NAZ190054]|nr:ATPase [Mycobacterium sp. NAZ190054]
MIPVIIAVIVIGALLNDAFLTQANIINVLQQSSELAILVVAEVLLLLCGKFDLSLESIVGFAPMVAAWLVVVPAAGGQGMVLNPYLGLLVLFGVGAAVGLANGLLVVKLGLNAFIATLAVLILLRGATLGVANGQTMSSLPAPMTYLGSTSMLGLPLAVWIAAAVFVGAGLFLRHHRLGRGVYAIGGNAAAARATGLRVDRLLIGVYISAGLLAALAGLLFMGRLASVTANQGQNMIFTVFAAAVIGGISLNGGRGSMVGAFTGVLLLALISNVLTLSAVSTFWIQAAQGAIILLALVLQRLTTGERDDS